MASVIPITDPFLRREYFPWQSKFSASVAMSDEYCHGRTESRSQGIVLALLLVACGVAATLVFGLAFRPGVMIFTMNTF
jgi:hypothetical protein